MDINLSYKVREKWLKSLNGRYFDVCVIGGGIAGAGIANILSANGISVLLLDKGDFASGTSSYSSKLIHGGIRYLQQGHILLTRELLKERNYLVKNTNFVKESEFNILIDNYSWNPYTIRLGLFIYELIGGKIRWPSMKTGDYYYPGFKGYFSYTDAITDDAYLTITNIVSAAMNNAMVLNYSEALSFNEAENRTVEVQIKDRVNGNNGRAVCRVLINATGPWINELLIKYNGKKIKNLKLSKGSHLIMENNNLIKRPVAFKSHIDRRQMFIIPRDEVLIAGTTDKFVDSPEDFKIDSEDETYIFDSVKRILPNLKETEILRGYAGIRPLYGRGNSPGRVTRDFHIEVSERMISIMGVKITNYRNASRSAVPYIRRLLGKNIATHGLPQILYERPNQGDFINNIIKNEMPIYSEDILMRRTGYYFFKKDGGESLKEEISRKLNTFNY